MFPLKKSVFFHIIIFIGLSFWTLIHLLLHFCSFGLDSTHNNGFVSGIRTNIFPAITGFLVLAVMFAMTISGIPFFRSKFRFVPFRVVHWVGSGLLYGILLIHGVNYWNPNFWKWLLPAAIVFVVERVYRLVIVKTRKVCIKSAGRYDSVSRTAIVELDKPESFEFEPGQYILLNLPMIGGWSHICECKIS